jgi:hypothetical protein
MVCANTLLSAGILLAVAVCFEIIAISVFIAAYKGLLGEEVGLCATLATVIGFLFCVGAILNLSDPSGESAIEQKLSKALEKDDRPQS